MLRTFVSVVAVATVCCGALAAENRCSATEKGSVLVYPKVEIRYAPSGLLVQDTIISLNNDYTENVHIAAFFVTDDGKCAINYNDFDLTKNETTYWSAATGLPKGVAPFGALVSPYPDPEGSNQYILRGYIILFATDNQSAQIRWNHLYGAATVINYLRGTAFEYNAYAFRGIPGATGVPIGTPGEIKLDGVEFDYAYSTLLLDFFAAWDGIDTDLTLVIANWDLRQDHPSCPPITKAKFYIWNENEWSYSAEYCIARCGWDESLISSHGGFFLKVNLQTAKGRARIEGMRSTVCDFSPCLSDNYPLLGVQCKVWAIPGFSSEFRLFAGGPLWGSGTEAGKILYDVTPPPNEMPHRLLVPSGAEADELRLP